jgi:hypothetical protein
MLPSEMSLPLHAIYLHLNAHFLVHQDFVGQVGFPDNVGFRESQDLQISSAFNGSNIFSSNPILAMPKLLKNHYLLVIAKVMSSCNNFLSLVVVSFLRRRDWRSLAVA